MKPTTDERADLLRHIEAARQSMGLSYAALAERTGVDSSQVSRICRGEFATFSDSVVRICTALSVQIAGPRSATSTFVAGRALPETDASWAKLERSVRRAWDKTPQGADRLARVITAVAGVVKR
jgi:transcriptional regulator with XRE-family HTH domain